MKSQWTDADAQKAVKEYGAKGVSEDLALRTYTTRLLGRDPMLVLHGGGNTSVKTRMTDLVGEEHDVLCVKGSGWDMGVIEPAGLPAVKLKPLQKLRSRKDLSDEDMVNFQRANLLDTFAPNPSVETLLHAFLPHKFVDHTHAAAVLSLVDQPDGEEMVKEVYGGKMGFVPYVISGFTLSKLAAEVYDQDPKVEGLILHKHGIFTFGKTAKEAYELMIEHITKAETRLAKGRRNIFAAAKLPAGIAPVADVAPVIRGACAVPAKGDAEPGRWVMAHRATPQIMAYVNGADVADYGRRGVPTPDHIIRTKNLAMVLPAPKAGDGEAFGKAVQDAVAAYVRDYDAYFAAENKRVGGIKTKLDPMPRVVLVPGIGMFGLGKSSKEAAIAADLAENAIHVVTDAEAIGKYAPLDASNLFDIEYWSLEQAKLKGNVEKAFSGQIVVVTGGGGAIGKATAKAFAAEGATPVMLDLDETAAKAAAAEMKGAGALGIGCDVTKAASVKAAFEKIAATYRRRRYRRVERGRGVGWQDRRGQRRDPAAEFRAEFLRASVGGAGRRGDHEETGDRRLPAVQRVETGGQSGAGFWAVWFAEGGDLVPDAAVRARLRRRGHPLERRQRGSYPVRIAHQRYDRQALDRARLERSRLHGRQSLEARSDGG